MSDSEDDRILSKLKLYGDSLLDEEPTASRREKPGAAVKTSSAVPASASKKRRKKKKKKNKSASGPGMSGDVDVMDEGAGGLSADADMMDEDERAGGKLRGEQKHLMQMRKELGLDELITQKQTQPTDRKESGKKEPVVEVVVYENPKKSGKKFKSSTEEEMQGVSRKQYLGTKVDLRQAKFDVQKFTIAGLKSADKEQAKIDLALSLGAKPQKRKYVNYKELMEENKAKKANMEAEKNMEMSMGYKLSCTAKEKVKSKGKGRKNNRGIGTVDGQLGKFKSGVQVLNREDLMKISKRK